LLTAAGPPGGGHGTGLKLNSAAPGNKKYIKGAGKIRLKADFVDKFSERSPIFFALTRSPSSEKWYLCLFSSPFVNVLEKNW
jgi:hypothetical protein